MNNLHVKKGDTVILMTGRDKYSEGGKRKRGKIVAVSPKEGKVIVEGMNKVTKHVKPRKMGDPGGRIEAEAAIYACKVQLVCPKCDKPTRTGHRFEEVKGVTKKVRVCKKCDAVIK
jgi:large subunit ribosomal protein L24